ncbi:MAG: cysteine--tRNA ligase [Alphaproteobacteria bacterium]|nr:cysteine--tRNA ligase [Alphaproteobacteria bacterium]
MVKLKLHNTLSGKKEDFNPINPDHVRVYACGPTVYNYAHIGNGRMAVVCDLLSRILRELYPKVTYVSNITDIDDKIIAASKETGEKIDSITQKYADIYNEDMAVLGVAKPDIQPRATQHIPDMIKQIEALIEKEHAYEAEGHVLYHVPSYEAYGVLSGRSRDEQIAGARVDVAPYKKDAADFVLWKPSTDDQPGWESPWGRGRPGWHIECSAMSESTLGLPFDIHAGGSDLKFPHHENEIAQACGARGAENAPEEYAKYWVHNGFVVVENEKMSKSIGNVQLVHDLIKDHKGETLRLALLSAHYRQPLNWTKTLLEQSQNTLDKMYRVMKKISDIPVAEGEDNDESNIMDALCDDMNTPKAIASLISLITSADRTEDELVLSNIKREVLRYSKIFGILQENPDRWLGYDGASPENAEEIESLIAQRKEARANKDFAKADEIRNKLQAMNIEIEDTAEGTIWRKIG